MSFPYDLYLIRRKTNILYKIKREVKTSYKNDVYLKIQLSTKEVRTFLTIKDQKTEYKTIL